MRCDSPNPLRQPTSIQYTIHTPVTPPNLTHSTSTARLYWIQAHTIQQSSPGKRNAPQMWTSPNKTSVSAKRSPLEHKNVSVVLLSEAGVDGSAWRHTPSAPAGLEVNHPGVPDMVTSTWSWERCVVCVCVCVCVLGRGPPSSFPAVSHISALRIALTVVPGSANPHTIVVASSRCSTIVSPKTLDKVQDGEAMDAELTARRQGSRISARMNMLYGCTCGGLALTVWVPEDKGEEEGEECMCEVSSATHTTATHSSSAHTRTKKNRFPDFSDQQGGSRPCSCQPAAPTYELSSCSRSVSSERRYHTQRWPGGSSSHSRWAPSRLAAGC